MNVQVLVAAATLSLSVSACKKVPIEQETGFRGEARLNSMLAAGRLMEHFGLEVETVRGFRLPDEPGVTLIVEGGAFKAAGPRLDALLDWVRGGGRAVVCLGGFAEGPPTIEEILEEFAVDEDVDFVPELEGYALLDALGLERTRWYLGDEVSDEAFGHAVDAEWPAVPLYLADGDETGLFQRVELGAGEVVVGSSGHYFTNAALGEADHAGLLIDLVDEGPGVLIAFVDPPGLFGLLRERAPWTLVALAALVLIWVWRRSMRFGPLVSFDDERRRDFGEHLERVGELLWRTDRGPLALEAARHRVLRGVHARRPDLEHAQKADVIRALAADSGIPEARVERALYGSRRSDPKSLAADYETLRSLDASSTR